MPRKGGSNRNAEAAVDLLVSEMRDRAYGVDDAWKAIVRLLLTCEVWRGHSWIPLHGEPVFRESNDYKLRADGSPTKALEEARMIRDYIAEQLEIPRQNLCSEIGTYLRALNVQPNNPRGHAFRSIVAELLGRFGDQGLIVEEEVDPYGVLKGVPFSYRSAKPKVDIMIWRDSLLVGLCSVRWSYRHDRVDMLEEASMYMPSARRLNPNCNFFGVTAEINPARLKKVVMQTEPVARHAAITRLVHVHPPLATSVIGHDAELADLMDLAEWVRDSKNWR
jgi:hypothetical protein